MNETLFLGRRNRPETRLRLSCLKQEAGGWPNAVHVRSDLDAVVQPISRLNGQAGGSAMIEATTAILALVSVAIFAAHAFDAYRTG